MEAARYSDVDVIVTRNTADFKNSSIPGSITRKSATKIEKYWNRAGIFPSAANSTAKRLLCFWIMQDYTGILVTSKLIAVVARDQHVDGRNGEQGEYGSDEHASYQHQTYGVTGSSTRAGNQGQREVAGNCGSTGHKDRPEPGYS